MSPAKSKSKDKSTVKAVKEHQQKASKLLVAPVVSGGSGSPASAYNPVSGTFHSLETVSSAPSPATPGNGRFRTIDETEEHTGSLNGSAEYDSLSNNDSCSGESEDQKDKAVASTTTRPEAIPGSDTDKRDKIRQKNERKHQRQREKRSQELHERCSGYLMSRKLETLAQQFVAMGFTAERATMALILNEGRVEESVAWLLEGGEGEHVNVTKLETGGNLKIDISDEMAKMADMEVRFKCSKQEVERAIVACEGDMEKAAETLKTQKQEPPSAPPKVEEPRDFVVVNGGNKVAASIQNPTRTQMKPVVSVTVQQQRKDERDPSYLKGLVPGAVPLESGNRNLQSSRRLQTKQAWPRPQVPTAVEKRCSGMSSCPSVPYTLASSPLQAAVPLAKTESRFTAVGTEVRTSLQTGGGGGGLREPVIVMQQPRSISAKQNPVNASPPVVANGWHQNGVGNLEMIKVANGGLGHNLQSAFLSSNGPSPNLQYHGNHYQPFASGSTDTVAAAAGWGGMWNSTAPPSCTGALSSLSSIATTPSSLGLFTGWGSTSSSSGSSSPVDWSTVGSMTQCDYNSIDWSLDTTPSPVRPKLGSSSPSGDTWTTTTTFTGANILRLGMNGGVCLAGLQEGGGLAIDPTTLSAAGSHEWTSPFAGKDLFRVPRQFVSSPSP